MLEDAALLTVLLLCASLTSLVSLFSHLTLLSNWSQRMDEWAGERRSGVQTKRAVVYSMRSHSRLNPDKVEIMDCDFKRQTAGPADAKSICIFSLMGTPCSQTHACYQDAT